MESYFDKENRCQMEFCQLGTVYHLWTPENFEIMFTCQDDFRVGMGIVGVAAKMHPRVKVITFELMTNHLHMVLSGYLDDILALFEDLKVMLKRYFSKKTRIVNWDGFQARTRELTDLDNVRSVIVYDNRNGSVVSDYYTVFTYPWGANRYYFNPDAVKNAEANMTTMSYRELREITFSHKSDGVKGLMKFEEYALPLSFCDITTGMNLFRDPPHYLNLATKNVESYKDIAKEIGESIFYSDNDLWAAISQLCRKLYSGVSPGQLPVNAKLELAKTMHYEYNASEKQISRMLKLPLATVASLGF